MNAPSIIPTDSLPTLINKATAALDSARSSAEVLEARDMARIAYDAAKSAARMMRAKEAHDNLVTEVHRSQAHALAIRARAEMRLAEEYDAAQDRGEVQTRGGDRVSNVAGENNAPTASDIGLRRDEIHDARKLRDAERAEPGVVQRTINSMIERGEEPTRATLKREIMVRPEPKKVMNPKALWLWGRLNDFERDGVLRQDQQVLLNEMTPTMRDDVKRLLPLVRAYLEKMEKLT